MDLDLIPLLTFVLITTFSPGPANVSSASMGVLHGYRKSLGYFVGLGVGVFLMMLAGGWLSGALLAAVPALESVLRWVGAAYILYMAFGILKASYTFSEAESAPLGPVHGLLLQISNPKLIVYALAVFSTFLAPIAGRAGWVALAAAIMASVAFCAVNLWALFGSAIGRYLQESRWKTAVNAVLALFLVYTAVELAGLL